MPAPRIGFARTEYASRVANARPCYAPLEANVFYVEGEDSRSLVVALELMQISREFSMQVRSELASGLSLSAEEVVTHCTHAHTTPEENDLRKLGAGALAERIAPAAREAMEGARPVLVELVAWLGHPRVPRGPSAAILISAEASLVSFAVTLISAAESLAVSSAIFAEPCSTAASSGPIFPISRPSSPILASRSTKFAASCCAEARAREAAAAARPGSMDFVWS